MRKDHWQTIILVGWQNVEMLMVAPRECMCMYVLMPDWLVGYEPSRLLLVSLPFVLLYYFAALFLESEVNKECLWWMAITKFCGTRVDIICRNCL